MNDGFRNLDVDVSLKLAFESLVPAVEKVRAEFENLALLKNQLTDVAADRPFVQSQRLADEISARERLIHKINEETSASETRISATESIVSAQYQRQPLDENKFQPSARARSSSTARERDVSGSLVPRGTAPGYVRRV